MSYHKLYLFEISFETRIKSIFKKCLISVTSCTQNDHFFGIRTQHSKAKGVLNALEHSTTIPW